MTIKSVPTMDIVIIEIVLIPPTISETNSLTIETIV